MDPDQKPTPERANTKEETKDDKYAAALAQMAALDYSMSQTNQPKTKHFISKKFIIWTVISLLSIIIPWAYSQLTTHNNPDAKAKDTQKTQHLINGAQELQDLQNQ